ncbi:hypothetical protein V2J09_001768 [Rumex salicifolius]
MTTNDEFIVGLEDDIRSLVAILVGKKDTTLAVVGTGGSGKTTLARKLYNHKETAERFPTRAWVCVSKKWNTLHLIHEICVQVGVSLQLGETSIPFHKLHEFLKNHSYLIVLDDVWRVEALQELLPILLTKSNGRVLITTRNRKVISFSHLGGLHIHKAKHLKLDESWELFSTIICKNWEGMYNFEGESSFAKLGKKMLKKCNGLPLAVVTLAGLLSTKSTIQEWECVSNDVMSRIMKHGIGSHDYGAMEEMLQLCYFDLPYYLKPCFLYLGIFQEDDHICVEKLIQLWIAEGFVKPNLCSESETLEELARDFLDELVQRCLVQVDGRDYEGKVQFVHIHDLMRDLCITKAKDLSFFEVSSSSTLDPTFMKPTSHRTIIHKRNSFSTFNPRLRSFISFEDHGGGITRLDLPYETMKLLRVLHLVKVDLGDTKEPIGNLTLLRYLRIERCSGINKLIQFTTTLKSLLTFVYNGNEGQSLPSNMVSTMEKLRHLSLSYDYTNARQTLLGVNKSRSLQVLRAVAGEWIAKELCLLTFGLQELQLTNVHSQTQMQAISNYVSNPNSNLRTLRISLREDSRLEFHLEKLKLKRSNSMKRLILGGKIRNQHLPLEFPSNLLSLELRFMRNLQSFKAHFVSERLCKRLQRPFGKEDNGDIGEAFHLVQHISLVEIRNVLKFHSNKKTYSI